MGICVPQVISSIQNQSLRNDIAKDQGHEAGFRRVQDGSICQHQCMRGCYQLSAHARSSSPESVHERLPSPCQKPSLPWNPEVVHCESVPFPTTPPERCHHTPSQDFLRGMRRLVQHSAIRQLLPASAHERLLPTFSAREVVIILSSAREDAVTCIPITQQGTWRQLPAYYIAKDQGPAAGL